MQVIRETPISVLFDGANNNGMVTMYRATKIAIAKASEHGMAVVGVNNSWVSGRSAYYVEMVARAGLVGMHTVASRIHVAAPRLERSGDRHQSRSHSAFPPRASLWWSIRHVGVHGHRSHFPGATQWRCCRKVSRSMHGKADPHAVGSACAPAVRRLQGFRALALDAGVRRARGFGSDADRTYGYLIMAIRPDLLVPLEDFRRHMSEMLARVKSTARQPGVDEIRLPGERSARERARLTREGIEIDRKILRCAARAAEDPACENRGIRGAALAEGSGLAALRNRGKPMVSLRNLLSLRAALA